MGLCTDEGLQQIFHRIVAHGLPTCERKRISLDGAGHGLGTLIKLAMKVSATLQRFCEKERKVREKLQNYYKQDLPTIKSFVIFRYGRPRRGIFRSQALEWEDIALCWGNTRRES